MSDPSPSPCTLAPGPDPRPVKRKGRPKDDEEYGDGAETTASAKRSGVSCGSCTFLNRAGATFCEMCGCITNYSKCYQMNTDDGMFVESHEKETPVYTEDDATSRRELELSSMLATTTGRAYRFVEKVVQLQARLRPEFEKIKEDDHQYLKTVAVDDMVALAEKMIDLQTQFRTAGKDHTVTIGYHYTSSGNLDSIRRDGLMTGLEQEANRVSSTKGGWMSSRLSRLRGGAFGHGIYTGTNPFAFQRFGDVGLIVAVMKGNVERVQIRSKSCSAGIDTVIGNKMERGAVIPGQNLFRDEVVLRQSAQCLPLICFTTSMLSRQFRVEDSPAGQLVWRYHVELQSLVNDFFNDGVKVESWITRPPRGFPSGVSPFSVNTTVPTFPAVSIGGTVSSPVARTKAVSKAVSVGAEARSTPRSISPEVEPKMTKPQGFPFAVSPSSVTTSVPAISAVSTGGALPPPLARSTPKPTISAATSPPPLAQRGPLLSRISAPAPLMARPSLSGAWTDPLATLYASLGAGTVPLQSPAGLVGADPLHLLQASLSNATLPVAPIALGNVHLAETNPAPTPNGPPAQASAGPKEKAGHANLLNLRGASHDASLTLTSCQSTPSVASILGAAPMPVAAECQARTDLGAEARRNTNMATASSGLSSLPNAAIGKHTAFLPPPLALPGMVPKETAARPPLADTAAQRSLPIVLTYQKLVAGKSPLDSKPAREKRSLYRQLHDRPATAVGTFSLPSAHDPRAPQQTSAMSVGNDLMSQSRRRHQQWYRNRSPLVVNGGPQDGGSGIEGSYSYVAPASLGLTENSYAVPVASQAEEECPVCLSSLADSVVKLVKCNHCFHDNCLAEAVKHYRNCPICRKPVVEPQGKSPSGSMRVSATNRRCSGFHDCGAICIQYYMERGRQMQYHPNPGLGYGPTRRTAYVPNNDEGRKLLRRLKYAFLHGLTFTVGTSLTSGMTNVIVWASIHHKTSFRGGAHGYPDSNYIRNCNEELDSLGVPRADCIDAL